MPSMTSPPLDVNTPLLRLILPTLSTLMDQIETFAHQQRARNEESSHVIHQMREGFEGIMRRVETLERSLETHDEELQNLRSTVNCTSCSVPCRDPYILPCEHMFCGRCLENAWRPASQRRIATMICSNGITVQELVDGFEDTEIGFQKVLRVMDRVDAPMVLNFASYLSPCCRKVIDEPPRQVLALTDLSNQLAGSASQNRNYFYRLFPLPILKW